MIDTSMKIDKNDLKKYVFDNLRNDFNWYDYSDGGYILTILYDDDHYKIDFITNIITYHFEILDYDIEKSNYVICVYTTDCDTFAVSGTKHIFTYDAIEKFIYDCF